MKIVFSHLARQELDDAVEYYETESIGLGERFRSEIEEALARLCRLDVRRGSASPTGTQNN